MVRAQLRDLLPCAAAASRSSLGTLRLRPHRDTHPSPFTHFLADFDEDVYTTIVSIGTGWPVVCCATRSCNSRRSTFAAKTAFFKSPTYK